MIYLETGASFDDYCHSVVCCVTDQGTEHLVPEASKVDISAVALDDSCALRPQLGSTQADRKQPCLQDDPSDIVVFAREVVPEVSALAEPAAEQAAEAAGEPEGGQAPGLCRQCPA